MYFKSILREATFLDILDIITAAVAVLPTIVIMVIVLFNSDGSHKPFRKIASVFAVSALSVIPAGIAEMIGEIILLLAMQLLGLLEVVNDGDGQLAALLYYAAQYFLIVGVAEELCKYFTFKWIIFHDREFDNTYDGVIYGAASALGFATLENIMYIFLNNDSALETAIMRALLSVPMHAVTGIVMGYCFGISKYRKYNNVETSSRPENKALIFSMMLHGAYDLWVTIPGIFEDMSDALFYCVLAVLMIFIYITLGRTVYRAKKQSHRIYNAYYYQQLDGKLQDMIGGQTSDKKRFFGFPLPIMRGGAYTTPPPQFIQGVPQYAPPQFTQGVPQYVPPQFTPVPPPVQPTYPQQAQPAQYQNYHQPQPAPNAAPAAFSPYNSSYPYPPNVQQTAAVPSPAQIPNVPRVRRFCSNCGEEAAAANKFCRVCGSALTPAEAPKQNFS